MVKSIIKKVLLGACMGALFQNITICAFMLFGTPEALSYIFADFARQFLCSMFIGIVFCVAALSYEKENWPFPLQVALHMGPGMILYFLVAAYAKWIPIGPLGLLLFILVGLVVAFAVWFGFYLFRRNEAKCMSRALQDKLKNG